MTTTPGEGVEDAELVRGYIEENTDMPELWWDNMEPKPEVALAALTRLQERIRALEAELHDATTYRREN